MQSRKTYTEIILNIFKRSALIMVFAACLLGASPAQEEKADLPDPVKFRYKYDMVINAVRAVLKDSYEIELEDSKAGIITTRPYEFISGSLTAGEVAKVAINKNQPTGNWLKARYSVEAEIELVSSTETLVTVRTKIEALNQDLDGTENWLPLESRGVYEKRILGRISGQIMGKEKKPEREGFWGQRPQPVDSRPSRFPSPPDR